MITCGIRFSNTIISSNEMRGTSYSCSMLLVLTIMPLHADSICSFIFQDICNERSPIILLQFINTYRIDGMQGNYFKINQSENKMRRGLKKQISIQVFSAFVRRNFNQHAIIRKYKCFSRMAVIETRNREYFVSRNCLTSRVRWNFYKCRWNVITIGRLNRLKQKLECVCLARDVIGRDSGMYHFYFLSVGTDSGE